MRRRELLEDGDPFPSLGAPEANGEGRIELPDDAEGAWTAVLLYRGFW